MLNFVLGTLSSLFAVFILYLFKEQLKNISNIFLFNIFPKISGDWKIEQDRKINPNYRDILTINQFGSRIKGEIRTFEGDKLISVDKIKGEISPDKIFTFSYDTLTNEHHNCGVALLKVYINSSMMDGHFIGVCCKCEEKAATDHIIFKKII